MLNIIYDNISQKKILKFTFINIINLSAIYLCFETKNPFLCFIPIIMFLISIMLFIKKGLIIDKNNSRYNRYISFLGIKSGKWYQFSNIQYLSLFETYLVQKDNYKTPSQEYKYKVYQLNLFDKNNNAITLFNAEDKDKAVLISKKKAAYLNVRVIDATKI